MKTIIQAVMITLVLMAMMVATFKVTSKAHDAVTKIIYSGMK